MIQTGIAFLTCILLLAGFLKYAETNATGKLGSFFKYVPAVVLLYLLSMFFTTFNVWDIAQSEIKYMRSMSGVRGILLPAMIFLMLLKADIKLIKKLGAKMILTFLAASLTIMIGFVVMFAIMKNGFLDQSLTGESLTNQASEVVGTFAALSGSWLGGSANMAAVQGALDVPDSAMTNVLVIDNINYSIWIMALLAFVSFAPKFNKYTKASTKEQEEISQQLEKEQANENTNITLTSILLLLGLSLVVAVFASILSPIIAEYLGGILPNFLKDFASRTTWLVLIATILGIIAASSPIGKIAGSLELGNTMLYIIIGLIASGASLSNLNDAPYYVMAGFVILFVHLVLMVIIAKIFKLDLFTCSIASLANIGAVASAPVLAAAYSKSLVSIGVLMGLLGYIVGTVGGLIVAQLLRLFI